MPLNETQSRPWTSEIEAATAQFLAFLEDFRSAWILGDQAAAWGFLAGCYGLVTEIAAAYIEARHIQSIMRVFAVPTDAKSREAFEEWATPWERAALEWRELHGEEG